MGSAASTKSGSESEAGRVSQILRREIVAGAITPGERLLELDLAMRFQVSRGPVREALRQLAAEYLVMLEPRRGARVIELSIEEVDDLFQMRGALFGVAAGFASARASEAEIATISDEIDNMIRAYAATPDPITTTTMANHIGELIVRAGRSPEVTRMIGELVANVSRHYQLLAIKPFDEADDTRDAWSDLGAALKVRDVDRAAAAARRIVDIGRAEALAHLGQS